MNAKLLEGCIRTYTGRIGSTGHAMKEILDELMDVVAEEDSERKRFTAQRKAERNSTAAWREEKANAA